MSDVAWVIIFFVAVIILGGMVYLARAKKKEAENCLSESQAALNQKDDAAALRWLKLALEEANEEPDLEMDILAKMQDLYNCHHVSFDMSDYRKLIEQYRILYKKSSDKSYNELIEVQKLKHRLIENMPYLPFIHS